MAPAGSHSGLACLAALRAHRRELAALLGKQVVVTASGAHLVSLAASIQERVSPLCDRGLFVERVAKDTLAPTTSSPAEPGGTPVLDVLPGSLSISEPDVHVTLGLDKGGDPGTVQFVA